MFCSRSRRGWSSPWRTSAFAARWKTVSQPSSERREQLLVEHVALARARRPAGRSALGDELAPARGKVVVDDDLDAVGAQPVRERAADEPGPAGDEALLHAVSEREAGRRARRDRNIWTVSSENCVEILAERGRASRCRSCVIVMMWQPIESAWTRFRTSRGLAQMSSARGATDARISSDLAHDRQRLDARRPRCARRTPRRSSAAPSRERVGDDARPGPASSAAVTLTLTPSSDSSRTSGASDSPVDVVTGTFT